jgi:hypothetical protein
MPWPAIIAAILQLVGPLLSELLKKWLDGQLKAAADRLSPGLHPAVAGAAELLSEVESSLWFWQRGKLRLVRECRAAVVAALFARPTPHTNTHPPAG